MSEKKSVIINTELPEDLGQFDGLDMMTYANGRKHAYGIDSEGKKRHISNDDIIRAYGYDPEDRPDTDTDEEAPVSGPTPLIVDGPEGDPDEGEADSPEDETLRSMESDLRTAEHEYAKRTAKARKSYLGRFCQGKTRLGKALQNIPGVGPVIEAVNSKMDTKTQAAKEEYERQFNELGAKIAEGLRALGYSEDQVKSLSATGVILRGQRLNEMIMTERKVQSKDTNKFVNWWVNAKGIKGKLAKVVVVGAASLLTGATAGAILPLTGLLAGGAAGVLAGGATGGGIARHVTRRRANSTDDSGRSLSSVQAGQDYRKTQQWARKNFDTGKFSSVAYITDRVEYRTDDEMLGNRRRMKSAIAIGKLVGGISGGLVGNIRAGAQEDALDVTDTTEIDKRSDPGGSGGPEADGSLTTDPDIDTESVQEELKGQAFTVESGHGFTHEWMDWAQANGKSLTPEESYELHKAVRERFGDNGILKGINTYSEGGDLRISSPGHTEWGDGVADFAKSWMQQRGKW